MDSLKCEKGGGGREEEEGSSGRGPGENGKDGLFSAGRECGSKFVFWWGVRATARLAGEQGAPSWRGLGIGLLIPEAEDSKGLDGGVVAPEEAIAPQEAVAPEQTQSGGAGIPP